METVTSQQREMTAAPHDYGIIYMLLRLDKMSVSKVCLLLMVVYLKVDQCAASSWTAEIPSSVKGLVGSCVVIPCSFNYPRPEKEVKEMTGIWTDATSHVIYHPIETKAKAEYHKRTKLLGDLLKKNCSLKIEPLWTNDSGPFYFRIEIANYNSYSYKTNMVSITTTTDPMPIAFSVKEEVLRGETVSANCSVSHSCPDSPPDLTWSHPGQRQVQQQDLGEGLWRITSTLTFQPNHTEINIPLQCTVTYSGGQQQQSTSKVLSVQYAPEIRSVSSCHFEGDQLKCTCFTESNPPSEVHLLLSDKVLNNTKIENYGQLTVATLQTRMEFTKFIKCTAHNTVGKADILLFLPNSNDYMYMGIGIGAAVVILMIVIIVVVARTCSQRKSAGSAPTSHKQTTNITLEPSQYTAATRKGKMCTNEVHGSFEHTYGNTETTFKADDDDAVYANV